MTMTSPAAVVTTGPSLSYAAHRRLSAVNAAICTCSSAAAGGNAARKGVAGAVSAAIRTCSSTGGGAARKGIERFSLEGKVALITAGAGDLFGSSVTEALAEAGATVITASRSLQRNQDYATSMRERGYDCFGYTVDTTDPASIRALRETVVAAHGPINILVNNAVVRDGHQGGWEDITATAENTAKVAAGDFTGLFEMCNQFIPVMQQAGGGSIINISSIHGVVTTDPNLYADTPFYGKQPPTYGFVKAGMIHFTKWLAMYLFSSAAGSLAWDGVEPDCMLSSKTAMLVSSRS